MSHTLLDTTQAALAIAAAIDTAFPPGLAEKLDSFNAALAFIEQEHDVSLDSFRELLGTVNADFEDEDEDEDDTVNGSQPLSTPSTPFHRADDFAMLSPEVQAEIKQRAAQLIRSVGIVH